MCLGHQAIGEAFGGTIVRAKRLMHGKTDVITADGKGVFAGLPEKITVARYHSLVIDRATCPACLEISAVSDDGEIQGVRHKELMVEGVQFHPESVASEYGHEMLANFLKNYGRHALTAFANLFSVATQRRRGYGCPDYCGG